MIITMIIMIIIMFILMLDVGMLRHADTGEKIPCCSLETWFWHAGIYDLKAASTLEMVETGPQTDLSLGSYAEADVETPGDLSMLNHFVL